MIRSNQIDESLLQWSLKLRFKLAIDGYRFVLTRITVTEYAGKVRVKLFPTDSILISCGKTFFGSATVF